MRFLLRRSAPFLLWTVWLAAGVSARAETCPAPEGSPGLAALDAETRLLFLLRTMDEGAAHLHTWSLVWGTTYAAATAAQLTALPLVHGPARIDLTAGAVAGAFGAASLYLLPLQLTSEAGLAHDAARDPDLCRALSRVEARLDEAASLDRLSASWIAHAGNVAVNAALALVLGLGYGRWLSAGISAAVGLAVGEANLWTQPHGFLAAEQLYRRALGAPDPAPETVLSLEPLLGPRLVGARLGLAW